MLVQRREIASATVIITFIFNHVGYLGNPGYNLLCQPGIMEGYRYNQILENGKGIGNQTN